MPTTLNRPHPLPYVRLETGMPVIVNHTDQPCTRLVAVITGFSERRNPVMQYLNAQLDHSAMEMDFDSVTSLEAFGVALSVDANLGVYGAVEVPGAPCVATYQNGKPRYWQQRYSDAQWCEYRPEVLAKFDPAYLIENI